MRLLFTNFFTSSLWTMVYCVGYTPICEFFRLRFAFNTTHVTEFYDCLSRAQ
jgi:hypothetical protein